MLAVLCWVECEECGEKSLEMDVKVGGVEETVRKDERLVL
jgi:hypothetical protein